MAEERFQVFRRVEFGETDMAGIVHFANFFYYMESAETEFLRSLGYSVAWKQDSEKLGFPRVSVSCDYLHPAYFENLLEVQVGIEKIGKKSIRYRFRFYHEAVLIAEGRITSVCCRAKLNQPIESIEIPAEMRAKLEPYLIQENESQK